MNLSLCLQQLRLYDVFFFSFICCLFLTWIQVHELFSKSGDVKRIIIGLDKVKKTACGFCFVEYPLIHFLNIFGTSRIRFSVVAWGVHGIKVETSLSVLNPCCTRYYTRAGAENAMRFINGTRLDDRIIRTDWDAGFKEGRQYGRGKSGGQVRSCGWCWFAFSYIILLFSFVTWICSVSFLILSLLGGKDEKVKIWLEVCS